MLTTNCIFPVHKLNTSLFSSGTTIPNRTTDPGSPQLNGNVSRALSKDLANILLTGSARNCPQKHLHAKKMSPLRTLSYEPLCHACSENRKRCAGYKGDVII